MRLLRLSLALAVALFALRLHAEPTPASRSSAFIRTETVASGARGVQTASTEYRPAKGSGPSVWLVGVAHIGTAEYFRALQERLDRQTVVLYEGIGLRDVTRGPGEMAGEGGVQNSLATALGLKFQLEAIDYRRKHFVNSDVPVPELREEVRKRGEKQPEVATGETFDQLLQALQGSGPTGGALNQIVGMLGATPEMREMTKLVLVEVLGQAGELLDMARTFSPEVRGLLDTLLTQRNEIVLRDLRAQLARHRAGESVAIFYGAAHMDEIAQRLRTELGYVPAQTVWDTAFAADAAQSGVNALQVQLMLQLLRSQWPAPVEK